jgi:hypothetical protein
MIAPQQMRSGSRVPLASSQSITKSFSSLGFKLTGNAPLLEQGAEQARNLRQGGMRIDLFSRAPKIGAHAKIDKKPSDNMSSMSSV